MIRTLTKQSIGLIIAGCITFISSFSQAETTNCTVISSVPFTISVSGIYCLNTNLNTNISTGAAITISADDVVLDLNGRLLNGTAGLATFADGIFATAAFGPRKNITIKNGTVRGFLRAIQIFDSAPFTNSYGHLIEDIQIDRNTFGGIVVNGKDCVIRNNNVISTGGSTFFGANAQAIGIAIGGSGHRVTGNNVAHVTKSGTAIASGIATNATDFLIVNNQISNADIGLNMGGSTGKFRDNITSGVTTPFSLPNVGVVNAGNNN